MKKLLTMALVSMMILTAATPAFAQGQHRGGSRGGPPNRGNSGGRGKYYGGHAKYYGDHGKYYGGHGGYYYGGHGHHDDDGWIVAGSILTGVLIGGVLQNAYATPEPPLREVVYTQPVYTQPVYQPAPVQYVQAPTVVVRPNNDLVAVWVQNSNGSKSLVALRRTENGQYMGPNGEYYASFPTNEQLRQLYGM